VGIVTGFAADQGVVAAWLWAAVLVAAAFVVGMVFPKLRPRYLGARASAGEPDGGT
jgi:hypothetical protein